MLPWAMLTHRATNCPRHAGGPRQPPHLPPVANIGRRELNVAGPLAPLEPMSGRVDRQEHEERLGCGLART